MVRIAYSLRLSTTAHARYALKKKGSRFYESN